MTDATHFDADAAFSPVRDGVVDLTGVEVAPAKYDPVTVRVLDRDWQFPAEVPTPVVLRITRLVRHGQVDLSLLSPEEFILLVGDLIPERYLREWSTAGLGLIRNGDLDPRMLMIVGGLVEIYSSRTPIANRKQKRKAKR